VAFVTVFDLPPVGVIAPPDEPPLEGTPFGVDALDSYADGGDGSVDDVIVSYEWDWDYFEEFTPSGDTGAIQSHTYTDLYLPIDAGEKQLFDAVDGKSTIGDIVDRTFTNSQRQVRLDIARTFFERLWWYDQVVFDTSRPEGTPGSGTFRKD